MIRVVSAFYQKMRLQVDTICAERKLSTDHFAIRPYFGKISRGLLYGGVCLSVGPSKTFKVLRPHSPTSRSMPSIYASFCEQCYPFPLCADSRELACLTVRPAKNCACAFHDLQAQLCQLYFWCIERNQWLRKYVVVTARTAPWVRSQWQLPCDRLSLCSALALNSN